MLLDAALALVLPSEDGDLGPAGDKDGVLGRCNCGRLGREVRKVVGRWRRGYWQSILVG